MIFHCRDEKALEQLRRSAELKKISHARIISAKFKSEEDLEVARAAWEDRYPKNMQIPLSRYIFTTGEN